MTEMTVGFAHDITCSPQYCTVIPTSYVLTKTLQQRDSIASTVTAIVAMYRRSAPLPVRQDRHAMVLYQNHTSQDHEIFTGR